MCMCVAQEERPTAEGDPPHTLEEKTDRSQDEPVGNKEGVNTKDEELNQPPTATEPEAKGSKGETKKEEGDQEDSSSVEEEEVAALLQNLANKSSQTNGNKRARRSARERKSSLYSDYETEFKGNWDQGTAYVARKKSQGTESKKEAAKEMYDGLNPNLGKKITENSKRLLDLLQSSAKQGRAPQSVPLVAPAPAWKPSRLSIAKFIESKLAGPDMTRPREFETAFTRVAPMNNFGAPVMNGVNEGPDKSMDTARLMSLLSSLTNQSGGMMEDRQQAMHTFSQAMAGTMQQANPAMLQSLLNGTLQNQPPQQMFPPFSSGMHAPPYHQ